MRTDYRLQECLDYEFKQTFPDLDYVFFGYNILKGYPLANGHDPGFTYPIFLTDYTQKRQTSDCRYSIPRGLVVVPDVSCVTSFSSEIVQDKYEFSKALSVSASVTGGGWGASFSASAGYKRSSSEIASGETVKIISSAQCNYYFSKLLKEEPPRFTTSFIEWVSRLYETDNKTEYFDFFETYGTHFPVYIKFGARFTYEHTMKTKTFETKQSQGVDVGVQASYSGVFSVGGGFNMDSSKKEAASDFSKSVTTKTITVGAPPPANGDALTWASTVKESPVPMEYKLESIDKLFSDKYMSYLEINHDSVAKNIRKYRLEYCNFLKSQGKIDSCESLKAGLMLARTRLESHYKEKAASSMTDCLAICAESRKCVAITFCKTQAECPSWAHNVCYMYNNYLKDGITAEQSSSWESIVFTYKIDTTDRFALNDTTIVGTPRSDNGTIVSETACKTKCENDAYCEVYSFCSCPDKSIKCKLYAGERVIALTEEIGTKTEFIPPK